MIEQIRPGVVGSVGDVLMNFRKPANTPDSPMRFDSNFGLKNASRLGSNVQDGDCISFVSGGGSARVYDGFFKPRSFRHKYGYDIQDLRLPDTSIEPIVGESPRFGWNNLTASIYSGRNTGKNFKPKAPFGLAPNEVSRGPEPRATVIDDDSLYINEMPSYSNGIQPTAYNMNPTIDTKIKRSRFF